MNYKKMTLEEERAAIERALGALTALAICIAFGAIGALLWVVAALYGAVGG